MGPYKVIKVLSSVSYKLALPEKMRIHLVIHVSQLKKYTTASKYSPKVEQPPAELVDGKEGFEVEKVLDK